MQNHSRPKLLQRRGTTPASIAVVSLIIGISSARSFTTLDQEYEKRLEKVLKTSDQFELCAAYVDLFEKSGPEQLRKLTTHQHDGVALQAAWEQIRRSVATRNKRESDEARIDSKHVHRFLGFLEGRLKVAIPTWWQATLLNTRFNDPDNVHFDEPTECPYEEIKDNSLKDAWAGPRNVSLERKDKAMQVTVDKQSALLPEEYLSDANYSISGLRTDKRIFLAAHAGIATPFELVCIDTVSGKVAWHTEVVADGIKGFQGSAKGVYHWVGLVPDGQRLLVFGAEYSALYIEAFKMDDGSCLFRYGTRCIPRRVVRRQ